MKPTVGFVGVGRMGSAMARTVLEAGFPLAVHDPDPEATVELVDHGAKALDTAADVARAASVVSLVVNSDDQVRTACTGPDGIFEGVGPETVVAIHATVSHGTLRAVAAAAPHRGRVLDAPVSGPRGHWSVGELAVMVGGESDAFVAAEPVFSCFGSLVVHLGPFGRGMDAKLALNALRYLNYLTMQESGRLAAQAGLGEAMFHLVEHAGTQQYMGDFAAARAPGEDLDQRWANVRTARKDLQAALSRGAELGVHLPWTRQALSRLASIWNLDEEGNELPPPTSE